MSNSLDPDLARQFVGPDLGPNCLPKLSADDTGRQRVKKELQKEQMEWQTVKTLIRLLLQDFKVTYSLDCHFLSADKV